MGSLTYLRVGYGKEGGEGEAQHHGQLRQLATYAGRERRSGTVRSVNASAPNVWPSSIHCDC
jgi:hypothetical protein